MQLIPYARLPKSGLPLSQRQHKRLENKFILSCIFFKSQEAKIQFELRGWVFSWISKGVRVNLPFQKVIFMPQPKVTHWLWTNNQYNHFLLLGENCGVDLEWITNI